MQSMLLVAMEIWGASCPGHSPVTPNNPIPPAVPFSVYFGPFYTSAQDQMPMVAFDPAGNVVVNIKCTSCKALLH